MKKQLTPLLKNDQVVVKSISDIDKEFQRMKEVSKDSLHKLTKHVADKLQIEDLAKHKLLMRNVLQEYAKLISKLKVINMFYLELIAAKNDNLKVSTLLKKSPTKKLKDELEEIEEEQEILMREINKEIDDYVRDLKTVTQAERQASQHLTICKENINKIMPKRSPKKSPKKTSPKKSPTPKKSSPKKATPKTTPML
jgi:hypothetical protein